MFSGEGRYYPLQLVSVIHNLIRDSATPHVLVTSRGTGRCDPLYERANYCSSTGGHACWGVSPSRQTLKKNLEQFSKLCRPFVENAPVFNRTLFTMLYTVHQHVYSVCHYVVDVTMTFLVWFVYSTYDDIQAWT